MLPPVFRVWVLSSDGFQHGYEESFNYSVRLGVIRYDLLVSYSSFIHRKTGWILLVLNCGLLSDTTTAGTLGVQRYLSRMEVRIDGLYYGSFGPSGACIDYSDYVAPTGEWSTDINVDYFSRPLHRCHIYRIDLFPYRTP